MNLEEEKKDYHLAECEWDEKTPDAPCKNKEECEQIKSCMINTLENILKYLNENYKNRQIIIFTCTDREKNILNKINILFNYIEL